MNSGDGASIHREGRDRRRYVIAEPARCAVCRRPVELVSGNGHFALLEAGRFEVHVCPQEAIENWRVAAMIRRIQLRAAQAASHDPARRSVGERFDPSHSED